MIKPRFWPFIPSPLCGALKHRGFPAFLVMAMTVTTAPRYKNLWGILIVIFAHFFTAIGIVILAQDAIVGQKQKDECNKFTAYNNKDVVL